MFRKVLKIGAWLTGPKVRQPIIKSLACFLLAAIVLQYSGILLLTQRYTMSRFYDVMLLVTNNSSNNTGSRRNLLQQGMAAEKRLFSERANQKHFIAQYLHPGSDMDDNPSKDEGYRGNDKGERTSMPVDENPENVPTFNEGQAPSDTAYREENVYNIDTNDKNEDVIGPITMKSKSEAQSKSRSGFMEPFWNIVNRIRDGLNPTTTTARPLPTCKLDPSELENPLSMIFSAPDWADLEKRHPEVRPGGHWAPHNCKPLHKVALVIPFRDRDVHLRIFLQHIHPFLQRQLIDYTVFVIEQTTDSDFNRAMLMNVGFAEGEKNAGFDCYIFHDVDLLPETLQNLYTCPHLPRHMSAAVDSFGYRLPYNGIFGGVSAMRVEHFRRVNGFSNCFFGWGGEDDDMYNRIKHHGLDITRYPLHVARYRMISHKKQNPSDDRFKMLNTGPLRFETDGLSSLQYDLISREERPLYTLIKVRLNKDDVIPKDLPMDASTTPGDEQQNLLSSANRIDREPQANKKQEDNPSLLTQDGFDSSIYDNHVSNDVKDKRGRQDFSILNLHDIEARLNKVLHINGDSKTWSSHKVVPQSPAEVPTKVKSRKQFADFNQEEDEINTGFAGR